MWPVIQRELMAEARSAVNRRTRLTSASLALGTVVLTLMAAAPGWVEDGRRAFAVLHWVICLLIWIVVPLLTADCISREVREGTLGLLFLTPLRVPGIMVGKGLVQAIRAMTIWWAALPALTVPILMGGIEYDDVVAALSLQFSFMLLALGCGMLASSYCRRREYAMILACAGTMACLVVLACVTGMNDTLWRTQYESPSVFQAVTFGLHKLTGGWIQYGGMWAVQSGAYLVPGYASPPSLVAPDWLNAVHYIALGCAIMASFCLLVAARQLRTAWQDLPPDPREQAMKERWLTPRFGLKWFKHHQHRLMEGNPISWLQQYSVMDRLLKWGLCIVLVSWETLSLIEFNGYESYSFYQQQYWTAFFISALLAFAAAGSFRRERENGALELILVTPIREGQLIRGRVFGIWRLFLPGLIPVVLIWVFWWGGGFEIQAAGLVVDFVVLPLVGFYLSLRLRFFLAAWLGTFLVAWLVPMSPVLVELMMQSVRIRGGMLFLGFLPYLDDLPIAYLGLFMEVLVGVAAGILLYRHLARRHFLIHRTAD